MATAITKPAVRRGGHKKRAGHGHVTLHAFRLKCGIDGAAAVMP